MVKQAKRKKLSKEFRIRDYPWPSVVDVLMVCDQKKTNSDSEVCELGELDNFMIDMATSLWRLKQKMLRPGSVEPLDEMKRAYRHFESAWDALTSVGVEVFDHTNIAYDAGLSLKVVAFQPVVGLKRETILETIKPTVRFRGKQIQMGAVVVGKPSEL